jgi:hypothetical protein
MPNELATAQESNRNAIALIKLAHAGEWIKMGEYWASLDDDERATVVGALLTLACIGVGTLATMAGKDFLSQLHFMSESNETIDKLM